MNAVIALCHFCEAHGPCAIFCTQTLRDTKVEELSPDAQALNKNCAACNSIGTSSGYSSKDAESNATFLSTQIPVFQEVVTLVKHASVRSLSCEVNSNKDGGFVFFGDTNRGHVLSHTFNISDRTARGFNRLFSIIILMKDKFFLLNIQPFLAENLRRISQELQSYARKVYTTEESINGSERDHRLSGGQPVSQVPRSLQDLTGEKHIFGILHSHFSWVLLAGSRFLTEHVTFGNLPWLVPNIDIERSYVSLNREELLLQKSIMNDDDDDDMLSYHSLRNLKEILKSDFISACYCAICGVQIVLRGPTAKTYHLMMCLRLLLPEQMHKVTKMNCSQYLSPSEFRIITVPPEVAVPQPNNSIFRIDFVGNNNSVSVKWLGELPCKWPDLMTKVIRAVDEPLFNDTVLEKQLKVLVQEWKNKITCINQVQSSSDQAKLKRILGIQPHDTKVVEYWSKYL